MFFQIPLAGQLVPLSSEGDITAIILKQSCFSLNGSWAKSADVYLQSETFHNEFTALPTAEVVPYWQGEEVDHKIMVTTPSGHPVTLTGIVGVMFDKDAMVVANTDRRVTDYYNPMAEFWNEWHKFDARYLLDLSENIVTFFIA